MISSFTGPHAFLSNFSPHPVTLPGQELTFPTAEHAYQCAKAAFDLPAMAQILQAPTPGEAKRLGRHVQLIPGWDASRRRIMAEILLAKFSAPPLTAALAATGREVLVEGNHWGDVYWGAVGTGHRAWDSALPWWHEPGDAHNLVYAGHNWLGRILMMTREIVS